MPPPTEAREGCSGLVGEACAQCSVHASSTAESTADDHLTLDGDDNVVVGADPQHAAGSRMRAADHRIVDGGTQWVVVSAGIAWERMVMARSHMPDVYAWRT